MAIIQSKDTQFVIGKNNKVEFEDKDIADNKTRSQTNQSDIAALDIRVSNVEALLSLGTYGGGSGGSGTCNLSAEVVTVPPNAFVPVMFTDNAFDYSNAMYVLYAYDTDADSDTAGGYVDGMTVGTYRIYSDKVVIYNNYTNDVKFKIVGIYGAS